MTEPATRSARPRTTSQSVGIAFFWSFLGNSFAQGMSLLLFLFIANFVSRESFGLMAVSLMTIEVARRLVIEPIAITLKSKPHLSDDDLNFAFTATLLVSLVIAGGIVLLAVPLANLIGTPASGAYLPFVAPMLVGFGLTKTHDVWLSRAMNFRLIAVRSVIAVIAGGGVGVYLALNEYEIWSLIGQQLTISLANVLTLWIATPWRPRLAFSFGWIVQHSKQVGHNSISNLWTSISQDSDIYFVSAFLGPVAAGLFSASRRILLAFTLTLTFTIQSVSMSALANIENERERTQSMLGGIAATALVTVPAFVGLSIVAVDIVSVVLPDQWAYAGSVLSIMAIGGVALTFHTLGGSILNVAQRADLNNVCSGLTALVAVVIFWFAAKVSLLAMAWAVVATGLLTLPLRFHFIHRVTGAPWAALVRELAPGLLASAAMYLATSITGHLAQPSNVFVALGMDMAVGVVVYVGSLRLLSPRHFNLLLGVIKGYLPSSRGRQP